MKVHTDFTTKKHTLVFETGLNSRRIELNKSESREFELWYEQKKKNDIK